ncbi:hypothetical protein ACVBEH_15800 [Roseateles sp. GG27B]
MMRTTKGRPATSKARWQRASSSGSGTLPSASALMQRERLALPGESRISQPSINAC